MEEKKANILLDNLDMISNKFELDNKFWTQLEAAQIFPSIYIDYMRNANVEADNKKKNLLIDLTHRDSTSFAKLSKILRDLYECPILDQFANNSYPITAEKPGYCLIINNEEFYTVDSRKGSELDVINFEEHFKTLNFDVRIEKNLTKLQMQNLLEEVASWKELKNYDIFAVIIMSHGHSNHVVSVDSDYVSYDQIKSQFSNENCPQLVKKPKLFIFNCCRTALPADVQDSLTKRWYSVESKDTLSDMVVVFSTLDNLYSVRHEEEGSLFVEAFIKAMRDYAKCNIHQIINRANQDLIEKVKREDNRIEQRQAIEHQYIGVTKDIFLCK